MIDFVFLLERVGVAEFPGLPLLVADDLDRSLQRGAIRAESDMVS